MSDYTKYGKAYYQAHRDQILAAEKEKKRWVDYYERNKEAIAERNRRRYYEKRGLPIPEKGTARSPSRPGPPPPPDKALIERFEVLVAELRSLAPHVVKPKKAKKAKKAKAPAEATPTLPDEPNPPADQAPGEEA